MIRLALAILIGSSVVSASPAPQQPATDGPQFDLASIRRNTSGSGTMSSGPQPGGRYRAVNARPIDLIRSAYELEPFQVVEPYPGWLSSERYDVNAAADGEFRGGRLARMLQALLAQRFRLVAHKETRVLPTHLLVRSREDGRLGPQIKPWTIDCEAYRAAGNTPPAPTTIAELMTVRPCRTTDGAGVFAGGGVPIGNLVASLKRELNSPVIDNTGLQGEFEILLRWNPENLPALVDPALPSTVFTALQEQLGLKLESRREPLEVLVIERIERPTEN